MAYGYARPYDPTEVLGRRFVAYMIDGLLSLVVLVGLLADRVASVAEGRAHRRVLDPPQSEREPRRPYNSVCVPLGSRAWVWNAVDSSPRSGSPVWSASST